MWDVGSGKWEVGSGKANQEGAGNVSFLRLWSVRVRLGTCNNKGPLLPYTYYMYLTLPLLPTVLDDKFETLGLAQQ